MLRSGFFQDFFMCEPHGNSRPIRGRTGKEMAMPARGCARLGMFALGAGAAGVCTPGLASADGLDFQISIDGYDLFPADGNTATATSSLGNIAIAFGNGATATTGVGTGQFSFADGTN